LRNIERMSDDVDVDVFSKTISELRIYLNEQRITCSDYRKIRLVRSADVANALKLLVVTVKDDYKDRFLKVISYTSQNRKHLWMRSYKY
jgi:hypothetical protein